LKITGNSEEKMSALTSMFENSEIGKKGIEELRFIIETSRELGIENIEFDITLARGLNYYTGVIFEVQHKDFPSSICGGGRYDDLTGIFGLKDMSGVGVSFGADRIYDLLDAKGLFPDNASRTKDVLFVNFGDSEAKHCLILIKALREEGIRCELYPDASKMKKQMKYANDNNVNYVAMVGSQEIDSGEIAVKDMVSGGQERVTIHQFIEKIKK
jgi:histidyl-tRNA synthetase